MGKPESLRVTIPFEAIESFKRGMEEVQDARTDTRALADDGTLPHSTRMIFDSIDKQLAKAMREMRPAIDGLA